MSCALRINGLCKDTKKRIIFTGALAYMHIFVVMFEMYMLCVSSDIIYYMLYYTMLGFLALLEFEINYISFGLNVKITVFLKADCM